ncbi:hypothetical protein F2Q69_00034951 [Brassica cretica]|uniref:Uncharacterized protein n=1 Tax=Brassica cretica TaxID=69181 RepID=A0A8S9STP7_BRACR|nr:hypothetical protein F2Q69_00034951 [Brassica cretica]
MCSSGPIDERSVRFAVVAFGQFVRIISIFNLATSRSYFEDYTYIAEGHCSLPDVPVELQCRLRPHVEFRRPKRLRRQTM